MHSLDLLDPDSVQAFVEEAVRYLLGHWLGAGAAGGFKRT